MRTFLSLSVAGLATLALSSPLHAQADPSSTIDARGQARVLNELAAKFDQHYWSIEGGKKIAAYLRAKARKNAYQNIRGSKDFAFAVSKDLWDTTKDYHLRLRYSPEVVTGDDLHTAPPDAQSDSQIAFAKLAWRRNQGFSDVRLLPGNIGYIELQGFYPAVNAGAKLASAMQLVANTDALIIDLMSNHGGEPDLAELLLSYLTPTSGIVEVSHERVGPNKIEPRQHINPPYVQGERYLGKPVYVLISEESFSAAEYFAYLTHALGLVTLVGEHTHGGVNPVDDYRLEDHFVGSVTYSSPTVVATGGNWTGGVKPDAEVPRTEALKTAQALALAKLIASGPPELRKERQDALDSLTKSAPRQP